MWTALPRDVGGGLARSAPWAWTRPRSLVKLLCSTWNKWFLLLCDSGFPPLRCLRHVSLVLCLAIALLVHSQMREEGVGKSVLITHGRTFSLTRQWLKKELASIGLKGLINISLVLVQCPPNSSHCPASHKTNAVPFLSVHFAKQTEEEAKDKVESFRQNYLRNVPWSQQYSPQTVRFETTLPKWN